MGVRVTMFIHKVMQFKNSVAIIIPSTLAKKLNIKAGIHLNISLSSDERRLILTPINEDYTVKNPVVNYENKSHQKDS